MGWIAVLAKPIRTMYATDSRAMMTKARQLIEKAEHRHDCIRREKKYKEGCPFKKPWGMQTDGDLWQVAWEAILVRGTGGQDVRWVKGHATNDDIAQGRSNCQDREGNNRSDTNADKGVEMLGGEGLVTLAKWAADRYEGYIKFMARVQKMIAAVTLAEKKERGEEKKKVKITMGYDPEKWVDTNCVVKNSTTAGRMYQALDLPPPIRGKHKYSFCQKQYLEVHAFMKRRRWAQVNKEEDGAGITWAELFVV